MQILLNKHWLRQRLHKVAVRISIFTQNLFNNTLPEKVKFSYGIEFFKKFYCVSFFSCFWGFTTHIIIIIIVVSIEFSPFEYNWVDH